MAGTTAAMPSAAELQPALAAAGQPAVDSGEGQAHLLALPDALLASVLGRLTSAADLAAAAGSCCALRALVHGAAWPGVHRLQAPRWSPALPASLRWCCSHCVELRSLDLSGAAAVRDADLAPLTALTALTALHLRGCWRVTGANAGGGSGGSRQLDVLAGVLAASRGLLCLDLSGTAVPVGAGLAAALALLTAGAPNATKAAHGLQRLRLAGCRRAPTAQGAPALRGVLLQCPALAELDVSGCRWVTGAELPPSGDAFAEALALLPLEAASFAGCDLLHGVGWLLGRWQGLTRLQLAGTAVDDADVEQIAAGCTQLRRLDLGGCVRLKGPALLDLAAGPAVQLGRLQRLRLADLAWVRPAQLGPLLQALARDCGGLRGLDLSSAGGLIDGVLAALHDARRVSPAGSPLLEELRLAHASRLTPTALRGLAGSGLLSRLRLLDVSHVQSLGRSDSSGGGGGGPCEDSPAAPALPALLEAAGSSLREAQLDGCWAGGGLLPLLARCCPQVERLSLVGCSGLGDADLQALQALRGLADLAVGGASLAWHEHRALTALTGLSRLRVARRAFLTDAQLGPLLAANRGSLRRLELAGCPTLTDAFLLPLLAGAAHPGGASASVHKAEEPAEDSGLQAKQPAAVAQLRHAARRPPAPPLQHLSLVCCDRVAGGTLRQLGRLQSLRLSGCPAIEEAALQAACVCCTQLTLLELPGHVPAGSMPIAPAGSASHLYGLQVVGGADEAAGGRRGGGRRRSAGTPR